LAIYEKFTGRNRDSFSSYEDLIRNYRVNHAENFNFAYDVLDVLGVEKPDKLAMLWLSDSLEEKRITFSEMMKYSNKTANYFKSLGIKKGDFVLLTLKRSYLFWYCMMALHKIGAIAVQATHLLTKKDYIYRCNSAGIKMAVITGDNECTDHFDEGLPEYETIELKAVTKGKAEVIKNGWLNFEAGIEAASDVWQRPTGAEDIKATDTMIVSFSSGTTGYPKMIAHDFTYPLGHLLTGVFWHRVVDGGIHFTISDTGWLKSLWGKMYGQWLGETTIFTYDFEKFNAANILKVIEKYKITTMCVPPTMYRFLLNENIENYDLSSLSHCTTAGEAMPADVFNQWQKITGLELYEGFGQTETTICCGTLYPYTKPVAGSMGMPVPNYDVVLTDEEMNECVPGVTGEMCIRAQIDNRPTGLFRGYYKNDEENAQKWAKGCYHLGDTAYRDERGYLWYVGRNDDIIKSSGYRIGPFEVESTLLEHPAVLETAVTGVPDPIRGFNVKATIVLRKDFTSSDELVKELQDFVKKNTAPYKYPRIIEFVSELPKTISGKIRRTEIRQRDAEKTNS